MMGEIKIYNAYITTIKELHKHSNADRLQCTTIFGNNVIVGLDYEVGQRIVFFPVDGQLSEEFAKENNLLRQKDESGKDIGGYLDPGKRNIKAIRLRGEKSEGLALPIEVLGKYTDIKLLKDGDTISVLNGQEICKKYIPHTAGRPRGHAPDNYKKNKKELRFKQSYPFFSEHVDTAQLMYNQNAFKPGDIVYLTLKMHGTSGRTMNAIEVTKKYPSKIAKMFGAKTKETRTYRYISGTRRTTLRNYNGGYYGDNEFRRKWHDFFKEKLPKGVEVFYEIVGYVDGDKTIMGKCKNSLVKDKEFSKQYGNETVFSYGCNPGENDVYVYRMTLTNEDGYTVEVPYDQMVIECEKMGAKCVPLFEKFIFTTWDDLMERVEKYYDGADPVGKTHIREGVVARIMNRNKFTAYKHKNFNFKVLESIVKDTSDTPDIEEAEELIVEEAAS